MKKCIFSMLLSNVPTAAFAADMTTPPGVCVEDSGEPENTARCIHTHL